MKPHEAALDAALDLPALQWLDRWLDARETLHRQALSELAGTQPALHRRVLRLLSAAETGQASRRLLAHVPPAASLASLPAAELADGTVVGGYRLIRELGRGGMSTVWLAEREDGQLKRQVALKLPLTRPGGVDAQRFARERDVLAALSHPGIARLLDAAVSESGQPFIVLEAVDGQPLDTACDARRLGLRERLALFQQVLAAVDHAHKHLVVHRDLKPGNILVDAQGQVRLLDFGIAKLLDDSLPVHALTQAAGCALTPRYAAPEQLTGEPITTATDVYALGVILFELLCGVSPYGDAAADALRWVRAIERARLPRPSQAVPDSFVTGCTAMPHADRWRGLLRGDLDNIVLKALQSDPGQRYASVRHLADDIQRYLEHRPVSARRPPWTHQLRLFIRRHRGASAAGALGSLVAIVLSGVAFHQYQMGEQQKSRTEVVRDFMFDLVDDVEADDARPNAEPTGRQIVAAAVRRARDRFADEPRLRGEVLAELGRMQGRLGDDAASTDLLAEAESLLRAHAEPADATLNKARGHLADQRIGQGRLEEAAQLAGSALAACGDGAACAKARYYAHSALSKVRMRQGRLDEALVHMRQAVAECEAGFGPAHAETAMALLALAITERQRGDLQAAGATLDRALSMSEGLTLRQSDRLAMWRIRAVLHMDLGDYVLARDVLKRALDQATPEAERAQLLRILAGVQCLLGEAPAALASAELALPLAPPPGLEHWLVRQVRARALSLLGRSQEAQEEMAQVVEGLRGRGYAADSIEIQRAQRFLAEMQLRAGQLDAGLASLRDLASRQSAVRKGRDVEYAQTLDLMGAALQAAGQAQAALDAHRQAARLLHDNLPADHPCAHRNLIYQLAALGRLHPTMDDKLQWTQQTQRYAQRFPATSLWRLLVQGDQCLPADASPCGLFL